LFERGLYTENFYKVTEAILGRGACAREIAEQKSNNL